MKRLLQLPLIAGLLAPLMACAGQPWQVQPVLGPSPTPVQTELAADEEGDRDEPSSDCRHEFGVDSSFADESGRAHYDVGSWATGCFVNGDAVDAFVIDAPKSGIYQIEFLHRGGATLTASVVDQSGATLRHRAAIEEGQLAIESIRLEAGHRYTIKVENDRSLSAWYELKAAPADAVAGR